MGIQFTDKKRQLLLNKALDFGQADVSSYLVLPKGTTAELAALDRREGALAFNTTLGAIVQDDGASFGGGIGAPATTKTLINVMESTNGTTIEPNVPFTFCKTGDLVVCQIGGFDGSTAFQWAPFLEFLPAGFRPFRTLTFACPLQRDGVWETGILTISTSGHCDWAGAGATPFGVNVVCTVPAMSVSYLVSEPA